METTSNDAPEIIFNDNFPEKVFPVDEQGNFITKPISKTTPITKYWSEKVNMLGVLMFGASLLLLIILLGESDLLANAWDFLLSIAEVLL